MIREDYNKLILTKIIDTMYDYPDLRFGQILINLKILDFDKDGKIKDPFYEESKQTWERIKDT